MGNLSLSLTEFCFKIFHQNEVAVAFWTKRCLNQPGAFFISCNDLVRTKILFKVFERKDVGICEPLMNSKQLLILKEFCKDLKMFHI